MLLAEFPGTRVKVRKSQVYYHLFAYVSFLKVGKKVEPSNDCFVFAFGLPAFLESGQVAAKTEVRQDRPVRPG